MTEHITIGDVDPRIQYQADGSQTVFTFPFPIFDSMDLKVYVDDSQLAAGITIAGAGSASGGSVTFDTAPANGAVVTLVRDLPLARTSDFQEGGAFRAQTINDELDRIVASIQQVAELLNRALATPATDTAGAMALPTVGERADRHLAFDSSGRPIASAGPAEAPVSAAMTPVVDAADLATARTGLGLGSAAIKDAGTKSGEVLLLAGDDALPALDGTSLTALPPVNDQRARDNTFLNAFRIAELGGYSVLDMVDGVADAFEDEAGVDTGASSDAYYDSTDDLYTTFGSTNSTIGYGLANDGGSWGDMVARIKIDGSSFTTNAGRLRVQFKSHSTTDLVINHAFIGEKATSGNDWDITGPISRLTFTGANGYTVPGGNATSWSDWLAMTIDKTKDYILIVDFNASNIKISANQGSTKSWYNSGGDATGTAAPSGYTAYSHYLLAHTIEARPGGTMDLRSVAITADTAPDEVRVLLDHEDLDSVVLNTDLTARVTRDGGTNWTTATLALESDLGGGRRLSAGVADVSAQPTGTDVRYRIESANGKEINIHSVGLQADKDLTL